MILPTMTPEEKVRQMEKIKPLLQEAAMGWMNRNHKIVFKTKVFPTFYTFERTFEGMGKWTVINLKHQLNYRHKADLDPFAPQENIFKFVDPSTRGYGLNKKSK